MATDIQSMQKTLQNILKAHNPTLRVSKENEKVFEVTGTKEVMQGKQKVDGHYFASIVPKPKDVRLYFFPIYTHKEAIGELSPSLQKFLKGKSCFHIKKLDTELEEEIKGMVQRGIDAYLADGLI